ncbi:serine protease 3-like [Phlebotomus argentipes]|uniref:serine protease 3-like n=1 Tax=Phlebotomus argentipes TaxID=94469 RepID=UPI0028937285|nr:serine protease 3-like [Phlebotomus argentipes]
MNIHVSPVAVLISLIISSVFSVTWAVKTPRLHEEPQSRIILGKPAEDGPFPFYVRIFGYGGPWSEFPLFICGGSIIDPRWVLSAGHCYFETTNASEPVTYHIEAGSVIAGQPRQSQIVMIKPFTFDKYVHPLRIALGSWDVESFVGEEMIGMGMGLTADNGSIADVLYWTKLTVIAKEDCQALYTEVESFDLPWTCFCAEDQKPPVSAICQGDSGGPVVIMIKGKPVQIGLVSFTTDKGCAFLPQAFTDVAKLHDWITLTMAKNA